MFELPWTMPIGRLSLVRRPAISARTVAALIDRAHVLHRQWRIVVGSRNCRDCCVSAGEHKQLKVAALDCLGQCLAGRRRIRGAERPSKRSPPAPEARNSAGSPLGRTLGAVFANHACEAAKATSRINDALVAQGLKTAENSLDRGWVTRMHLELAELNLRADDSQGAVEPLTTAASHIQPSPEILARTAAVRALAALKTGDHIAAASSYEPIQLGSRLRSEAPPLLRTYRMSAPALQPRAALKPLTTPWRSSNSPATPTSSLAKPTRCSELSGAADGLALVARGDKAIRCVAARGWTEAQALEAAAAARRTAAHRLRHPPRRGLGDRRRPPRHPQRPLHRRRHPQARRHRRHHRPLPPRGEAARRALAGRHPRDRRRPLGLRADDRAALDRQAASPRPTSPSC